MHQKNPDLTEADTELLSAYIDGELGFWAKRRAERVIRTKPEAQSFLDALREVSSGVVGFADVADAKQVDLWTRIDRRLTAEENAALYLGKRGFDDASGSSSWSERLGLSQLQEYFARAAWGMGGAVVAAGLTFAVIQPAENEANNSGRDMPAGSLATFIPDGFEGATVNTPISGARFVSATNTPASASFQKRLDKVFYRAKQRNGFPDSMLDGAQPPGLEVEWMRSDGQLKVIPGMRPGSSMIWVKRPSGDSSNSTPRIIESREPALLGSRSAVTVVSSPALIERGE